LGAAIEAEQEAPILIFEPDGTPNPGDAAPDRTVKEPERIG
jgi:hypothetical protein